MGQQYGTTTAEGKRPRRFLLPAALATLASGLAVFAGIAVVKGTSHTPPAPAPLPASPFSLDPSSVAHGSGSSSGSQPGSGSVKVASNHVVIPSLKVDARVVTESVISGGLGIPRDLSQVARYSGGAGLALTSKAMSAGAKSNEPMSAGAKSNEPVSKTVSGRAASAGTTLLAGHVNYGGVNGALYKLASIKPGADVYTADNKGTVTHWRVFELTSVVKAALPQDIFTATGPRRLVIVTCGGSVLHLAGGNTYEDNVLAYAVPVHGDNASMQAAKSVALRGGVTLEDYRAVSPAGQYTVHAVTGTTTPRGGLMPAAGLSARMAATPPATGRHSPATYVRPRPPTQ